MPVIFMGAFKRVTEDERELLDRILADSARDVDLAERAPPASPPPAPPGTDDSSGDGWRSMGVVEYRVVGGRPVAYVDTRNRRRTAVLPRDGWDAIVQRFEPRTWYQMAAISFLESDFQLGAENPDKVREDSWGPFQVNRRTWPQYSVAELTTWAGAARAARDIYNVQGFRAWLTASRLLGLIS